MHELQGGQLRHWPMRPSAVALACLQPLRPAFSPNLGYVLDCDRPARAISELEEAKNPGLYSLPHGPPIITCIKTHHPACSAAIYMRPGKPRSGLQSNEAIAGIHKLIADI